MITKEYIFSSCGFFFFFLSFFYFLTYSQWSDIGCLPYFHTWCGLRANLECRSETSVVCVCCQEVLKDMSAAGVSPDIDTFDTVLFILTQYRRLTVVRTWSMNVLSEIRQCGLGNDMLRVGFKLSIRAIWDVENSNSGSMKLKKSQLGSSFLALMDSMAKRAGL